MEEYITRIRYKLLDEGFMSEVRIKNELKRLGCNNIDEVLVHLQQYPGIHKIRYANRFIAKYCTRELYFYNPNYNKRNLEKNRKKKNNNDSSQ